MLGNAKLTVIQVCNNLVRNLNQPYYLTPFFQDVTLLILNIPREKKRGLKLLISDSMIIKPLKKFWLKNRKISETNREHIKNH